MIRVAVLYLSFALWFGFASNALACRLLSTDKTMLDDHRALCNDTVTGYGGVWEQRYVDYGPSGKWLAYECHVPIPPYPHRIAGSFQLVCDNPPMEPPTTPVVPPDAPHSCLKGSVVNPEARILQENIPIAGTAFHLNYSSNRQLAYSGYRKKQYQVHPSPCLGCIGETLVKVHVGAMVESYSVFRTHPGFRLYEWDGLDDLGHVVLGSLPFKVEAYDDSSAYALEEVWTEHYGAIGSFYAIAFGLGGWTISPVHFYDVNTKTVFKGDGYTFGADATVLSGPGLRYRVVSDDGMEVFYFDSSGRHVQTKTAIKGAIKFTFGYTLDKLTSITDGYSNVTTINYNSGKPSSIVSPYGVTTTIGTNSAGYITSVSNPNSETYSIGYHSGWNLIQTFEKPNGVVSTFGFDIDGQLLWDQSSAGSSLAFTPHPLGGFDLTTDEGIVTRFLSTSAYRGTEGPAYFRAYENYTKDPTSRRTVATDGIDKYGGYFLDNRAPDPRLPGVGYLSSGYYGPTSHVRYVGGSRSATLSDPDDIYSVVDLGYSYVLNSTKTTTISYLASTSKYTRNSPVGRKQYVTIDSKERPTALQYASLTPITLTYDGNGRVSNIAQGLGRTYSASYNSAGKIASLTNPLSESVNYGYDSVGRITSQTLPDARVIGFAYDLNGNLASVTPPNGYTHTFLSNGFDLVGKYSAPAISLFVTDVTASGITQKGKRLYNAFIGTLKNWISWLLPTAGKKLATFTVNLDTDYSYDNDRRLTSITRPDGAVASFAYSSPTGRLTAISTPAGSYTVTPSLYYDHFDSIASPDGVTTNYTYSGPILLEMLSSGTTVGNVYFTYNADHLLASTKVNTATAISFAYDNDGLLTTAGNQSIVRNAATGFPTKATLSTASENYTFSSSFGELSSIQGKYSTSTNIYLASYTRDALSRISQKIETIGAGSANTFDYTYDSAGRLTTILKNSSAHASYTYDANSNRTSITRGGVTTSATFDEQDRILTFGTKTYTHNDAGEITQVSDGSSSPAAVTSYTYDVFGNIKSVTLPSSTVISYVHDGQGRRVGRKVGGAMHKQFVWFDQLRVGAELNSTGTLVTQFVYGLKGNVPDYMIKGGVRYKIMTDHLGSVVAVVHSTTGAIAQAITYDEFGKVLSDTAPGFQPFGFAGGLYDSDTKLTLFGVRSYDAETGRWLSKDPILFNGGDTNLYGYVMNDPINFIDPSGLFFEDVIARYTSPRVQAAIGGAAVAIGTVSIVTGVKANNAIQAAGGGLLAYEGIRNLQKANSRGAIIPGIDQILNRMNNDQDFSSNNQSCPSTSTAASR